MLNRHLRADIVLQGGHKAAPQQGIGENMMLREILTILLGVFRGQIAKPLMQPHQQGEALFGRVPAHEPMGGRFIVHLEPKP